MPASAPDLQGLRGRSGIPRHRIAKTYYRKKKAPGGNSGLFAFSPHKNLSAWLRIPKSQGRGNNEMAFHLYIARGSSEDCEDCRQPADDREMIFLQVTSHTNGTDARYKQLLLHLECFEKQFFKAKYRTIFYPTPLPD